MVAIALARKMCGAVHLYGFGNGAGGGAGLGPARPPPLPPPLPSLRPPSGSCGSSCYHFYECTASSSNPSQDHFLNVSRRPRPQHLRAPSRNACTPPLAHRRALAPHGAPSAHRHRPAAERFRPVCRRAALRAATTTSRRRPWSCGGWHSAANGRRSDRSERGPVGIQSGSSSARHIATLRPSLLASPFPPPRARPAPPPPPAAGDVVPHWGSCGLNYGGAPAAFVNSPSKGRRGRLRGRGHGRGRGRGRPGGGAEGRLGKALGSSGHKVATLA